MSKRHAKPTPAQVLSRIYRRQLVLEKKIERFTTPSQHLNDIHSRLRHLDMQVGEMCSGLGKTLLGRIADLIRSVQQKDATIKTLADHCARLMREKETLVDLVPDSVLAEHFREANEFMSDPLRKS